MHKATVKCVSRNKKRDTHTKKQSLLYVDGGLFVAQRSQVRVMTLSAPNTTVNKKIKAIVFDKTPFMPVQCDVVGKVSAYRFGHQFGR
jgi:hypothetical protein